MLVKIFSFPICERHNIILSKLLFWNALFVCIAKILYIKADHNFQMLKSVLLWFTVTVVVDHCSLTCHYKLLHCSSLHVSRILSLMNIMQPEKHWEVFKYTLRAYKLLKVILWPCKVNSYGLALQRWSVFIIPQ